MWTRVSWCFFFSSFDQFVLHLVIWISNTNEFAVLILNQILKRHQHDENDLFKLLKFTATSFLYLAFSMGPCDVFTWIPQHSPCLFFSTGLIFPEHCYRKGLQFPQVLSEEPGTTFRLSPYAKCLFSSTDWIFLSKTSSPLSGVSTARGAKLEGLT